MRAVQSRTAESSPLRVAVHARDPARCAALVQTVIESGHLIVNAELADVVLVEGEPPPAGAVPQVFWPERFSSAPVEPPNGSVLEVGHQTKSAWEPLPKPTV